MDSLQLMFQCKSLNNIGGVFLTSKYLYRPWSRSGNTSVPWERFPSEERSTRGESQDRTRRRATDSLPVEIISHLTESYVCNFNVGTHLLECVTCFVEQMHIGEAMTRFGVISHHFGKF